MKRRNTYHVTVLRDEEKVVGEDIGEIDRWGIPPIREDDLLQAVKYAVVFQVFCQMSHPQRLVVQPEQHVLTRHLFCSTFFRDDGARCGNPEGGTHRRWERSFDLCGEHDGKVSDGGFERFCE